LCSSAAGAGASGSHQASPAQGIGQARALEAGVRAEEIDAAQPACGRRYLIGEDGGHPHLQAIHHEVVGAALAHPDPLTRQVHAKVQLVDVADHGEAAQR
jgi:hypothetical protein